MQARILLILFSIFLMSAGSRDAVAEKCVALVIGNLSYRNVPSLTNPASDVRLMADMLRTLGF